MSAGRLWSHSQKLNSCRTEGEGADAEQHKEEESNEEENHSDLSQDDSDLRASLTSGIHRAVLDLLQIRLTHDPGNQPEDQTGGEDNRKDTEGQDEGRAIRFHVSLGRVHVRHSRKCPLLAPLWETLVSLCALSGAVLVPSLKARADLGRALGSGRIQ